MPEPSQFKTMEEKRQLRDRLPPDAERIHRYHRRHRGTVGRVRWDRTLNMSPVANPQIFSRLQPVGHVGTVLISDVAPGFSLAPAALKGGATFKLGQYDYVEGRELLRQYSDSPTNETSRIHADMDFVTGENGRRRPPQPRFCLSATAKRLAPKTRFLPVGNFIKKSSFCFLPVGNWIRFYLTFTNRVLYDVSVMKDVFTNRHQQGRRGSTDPVIGRSGDRVNEEKQTSHRVRFKD